MSESSSREDDFIPENNDIESNDDGSCTWCSCLDEYALLINSYIERGFSAVGYIVGSWPYVVLGFTLLFLGLCCFGYINIQIETELFDLWTPSDSPVFSEKEFINYYWGDKDYGLTLVTGYAKAGEDTNILDETYIDQWNQIHLDLATKLPKKEYTYYGADNGEYTITFGYFAENYNEPLGLTDISQLSAENKGPTQYASQVVPLCRPISQSPAEGQFIMPCYIATLLDCFTEGGYFFPYENYLEKTMLSSLIPANLYTYQRHSYKGKDTIELGEIMGPSCSGFTGVVWPPNMIYGGETRINSSNDQSTLIAVKSFQLAAFTDSATNIARKMKTIRGDCLYTATYGISCPDITEEERDEAQVFMDEWLLDVIDFLTDYAQELNDDDEKLFKLVFFTPRTTRDLLREASSADFGLLALAYIAMIIFASLAAINVSDWFLSRSEASFAGVLLVLFAVVATIGLGSFAGVPLSPNIVQVLPFIALGFGVDDMFVLLFSFKFREKVEVPEMISETIRIAGSSVALTSMANFFGFVIGTTMVLPDVSRFASFGAIIVLLNFIAIIFGFTAVLTLVARRMKNEYNDWSFLFCWASFTRATKISSQKVSSLDDSLFDPLFDWLTKTYTRIVMVLIFFTLIIVGIYGCTQISPGLPLDDIVPATSYASEFLRIRELYYSSYPLSLITDANEGDLKPIDWSNKFEDWLQATDDIFSISDNVYSDPGVHSFWAWSMRKYLIGKYDESLTGEYELGAVFDIDAALSDDPIYQAFMCKSDAKKYCRSVVRAYEFKSDLFNCLLVNYQLNNLQSDCNEWVEMIYIANTAGERAVAKQLYITSYDDDTVNGLYVRPSTNDIKVYIKQPDNDGYIYQKPCAMDECPWYILDAAFNILYFGEATAIDAEAPAQGGWRDGETGKIPVAIVHTYYDFGVEYYGNTRDDVFMSGDYTPSSVFSFSNVYNADDSTTNACTQWEVMRLLMSETDAFRQISMSDVLCDAYLESSEICVSIRDASDLGSVYCGEFERTANNNLWYLGTRTSDDLYQIMSTPNDNGGTPLTASSDIFNNCNDPTSWSGDGQDFSYNYFAPCGDIDSFGGSGISKTDSGTCASTPQDINLECIASTDCTDLRACYNDFQHIFLTFNDLNCNGLVTFYEIALDAGSDDYGLANAVDECSFKYYTTLSDCCRSAVNKNILDLAQYRCSGIDNVFQGEEDTFAESFQAVCKATDDCQYNEDDHTCTEVYTGEVFDDCHRIISGVDSEADCSLSTLGITKDMIRSGEQEDFYNCLSSNVGNAFPNSRGFLKRSGSDFCQSTFDDQSAIYPNCLYPVDSFYDVLQSKYDYSMCADYDFSINNISDICGSNFTDTTEQLECLIDITDLIDPGCCKLVIEQINTESFSFTNECERDTYNLCAVPTAGLIVSAGTAVAAALVGESACLDGIVSAAQQGFTTPKCLHSMLTCEATSDGWLTTAVGATTSMDCGVGYIGEKHRTCLQDTLGVKWGNINTTECVPLTCPEILSDDESNVYNQYWPETAVGSVYKIQGGMINGILSNAFTDTQISTELQAIYVSQSNTTVACDPQNDYNEWYARRACVLNPYDSSEAIWSEPLVECKPFMSMWNNVLEETICDFITEQVTSGLAEKLDAVTLDGISYPFAGTLSITKKANLIDAVVWSIYDEEVNDGVSTDNNTHISLSKALCTQLLTNCAAFTYDEVFAISYFFDYCPTLNSDELNEAIPEIMESPSYVSWPVTIAPNKTGGPLDTLAYYQSLEMQAKGELPPGYFLEKNIFASWSTYPDPIFEQFYPDPVFAAKQMLSTFADRHKTYIAPLNSAEFIASYCSLRSVGQIVASMLNPDIEALNGDSFIGPRDAWSSSGIPHPECFNNLLWLFFIDPTGNGVIKRDSVYFVDPTQVSNLTGFDNVEIVTTSNTMIISGIDDDEVAVEFITDLRERLDDWKNDELYAIPSGLIIRLFSQYINVSSYLVANLIYVSIAIACCGLIFLLNPIAVIVAILCNTAMVIEVYGFSDWFGLRVNGVLVLNIVVAVALTMEFTAHIGRAFVLSFVTEKDRKSSIALPFSDDGQIRMKKTLREMFTPVSLGALTTVIGVAPIAGAQFPYFRQYYFTLYIMIVLFGWLNGVIFQPIILSFIPPQPFITDSQLQSSVNIVSSDDNIGNNNNDSLHEPLVQHHDNSAKVKVTPESPINIEMKAELVKRKHTRNDSDAP